MRLKINIVLWVLVLFCLCGSLIIAQNTSPAGQAADSAASGATQQAMSPGVQEKLQHLGSALNLTSAQKEQIKPLLEQEAQQLKEVREDTSMSDDQKEAKMQQVHASVQGQIQSVLTPEQQQKLSQMKANAMQR